MDTPYIPTDMVEWNKENRTMSLTSDPFGMPSEFYMRSSVTGKVVKFIPIGPNHPKFDQDGWDGEQMVYEPVVPLRTVETCTIYHAY